MALTKKVTVLYVLNSALARVHAAAEIAREAGQSIRLVGIQHFRGEAETGAGRVAVQRREDDDEFFQSVEDTYPHLEIGSFELADLEDGEDDETAQELFDPLQTTEIMQSEKEDSKALRAELIELGGSVPANADDQTLRELIAKAKENAAGGEGAGDGDGDNEDENEDENPDADLDEATTHKAIDAIIKDEEGFELAEGVTLVADKIKAVRDHRAEARKAAEEAAQS